MSLGVDYIALPCKKDYYDLYRLWVPYKKVLLKPTYYFLHDSSYSEKVGKLRLSIWNTDDILTVKNKLVRLNGLVYRLQLEEKNKSGLYMYDHFDLVPL
jgi:hypothetical protein